MLLCMEPTSLPGAYQLSSVRCIFPSRTLQSLWSRIARMYFFKHIELCQIVSLDRWMCTYRSVNHHHTESNHINVFVTWYIQSSEQRSSICLRRLKSRDRSSRPG